MKLRQQQQQQQQQQQLHGGQLAGARAAPAPNSQEPVQCALPRSSSSWSSASGCSTTDSSDAEAGNLQRVSSFGGRSSSSSRSGGAAARQQNPQVSEEERRMACGRLESFLRRHGSFPANTRARAWQLLLQLPRNEPACQVLDRAAQEWAPGTGLASAPGEGENLGRGSSEPEEGGGSCAASVLRRLEGWSTGLAGVAWLPGLVGFAAQAFSDDGVLAFEMCACLLLNWASPWLDTFPGPPVEAFAHAEELLNSCDPQLASHLRCLTAAAAGTGRPEGVTSGVAGGTPGETKRSSTEAEPAVGQTQWKDPTVPGLSQSVLWPMARTLLTGCLQQSVWLILWDHLVLHWREPWLLGVAVVAVLRCLRHLVLALPAGSCTSSDDTSGLKGFLRSPRQVDQVQLIREFHDLRDRCLTMELPEVWVRTPSLQRQPRPLPLPSHAGYPSLVGGPHLVLDYLASERRLARAEGSLAALTAAEASRSRQSLEALAAEEHLLRTEQAKVLRAERAKLELMKDTTLQHVATRRTEMHASGKARIRLLDTAWNASSAALGHQALLQEAEAAARAEEDRRRRMGAKVEEDAWRQHVEFTDLESWASKQLGGLVRGNRAQSAKQQLHQELRQRMELGERRAELQRRQHSSDAQKEQSQAAAALQRHLEEDQKQSLNLLRQEAGGEFELESLRQQVRLLRAERARAGRTEAAERQAEAAVSHRGHRQRLAADAASSAAGAEGKLLELREAQKQRLQQQQQSLGEAKHAAWQSLERQEEELYDDLLADERQNFQGLVRGAQVQDELAAQEVEERLGVDLARLGKIRLEPPQASGDWSGDLSDLSVLSETS
ncbi:unnamed protein product [Polarella glacialis]|uniref:Rab-GAP TBC domain-containing protein n=1 Tax=Polarella glacialis TaxID=89957 RepID=A0A813HBL0_POLGL|nr:unnamed protein product [Polarella glacialis]